MSYFEVWQDDELTGVVCVGAGTGFQLCSWVANDNGVPWQLLRAHRAATARGTKPR